MAIPKLRQLMQAGDGDWTEGEWGAMGRWTGRKAWDLGWRKEREDGIREMREDRNISQTEWGKEGEGGTWEGNSNRVEREGKDTTEPD